MNSAVRWYERAVSGELGDYSRHLALDRCILGDSNQGWSDNALPAGLSAVLGDRPVSGSGVPVGIGMTMATADGEQRPWIDDALPGSLAASGGRDLGDNPVLSKALMKSIAAGEPGVGASPQGIIAGTGKGDAGVGSPANSMPPKALAAAQRAMSKPAPSDAVSSGSVAPDPVPSDRLASVLFGGEKPSSANAKAQEVPGPRTETVNAAMSFPGLPEAVADGKAEASGVSRTAAVSMPSGRDGRDRYGLMSRARTAAGQSRAGVVPVGKDAAWVSPQGTDRRIDRIVGGQLDRPSAAADPVLAGISQRMADSRFRDPAMEGRDVVPRRADTPMQGNARMKPQDVFHRAEAGATPAGAQTVDGSSSAARSSTGSGAARTSPAGTVVALRGDVMMDGRKMGRMVATGQTSAASLPTISGSAINLRAIPVFAGTGAAL